MHNINIKSDVPTLNDVFCSWFAYQCVTILGIVYASEFMKRQKTTSDWASERAEGLFVQSLHNFFGFFGQCAQGAQGFVTKMSESMTAMRQNAPSPSFNLFESKFRAMTVEAEIFYSQYQNQTWKNIISASAE